MQAIAERKKSQNIGEYLVYMYQMEDLIRSYQGNMEEINLYVIAHYPVPEEEKESIKIWFAGIAASMQQQELMQKGHLQELQELVQQLLELHYQLLKTDANYVATFHRVKPHLLEAIDTAAGEEVGNEIQMMCALVHELTHHAQYELNTPKGELETTKNELAYLQEFHPETYKKCIKPKPDILGWHKGFQEYLAKTNSNSIQ